MFVTLALIVALFHPPDFPTVDAPAIPSETLREALAGFPVETLADLKHIENHDVLILPHGSAFPVDAWPEIRAFVKRGGSLVVLGGAPFHVPVRKMPDGRWQREVRQPRFARELLIGPAEAVSADGLQVALPDRSWSMPVAGAHTVWELTVRLATRPDFPAEHGSEGPRDGVLRPLVHLVDANGTPRACPLLEIDRLGGDGAGGRWIFAPSDAPLSAPLIRALVERALQGAFELTASPKFASIEANEVPVLRVNVRGHSIPERHAQYVLRDDRGRQIQRGTVAINGETEIKTRRPLRPGLHHLEVTCGGGRSAATGFWVRDAALLDSGPKLTVSRDWLRRDGTLFPVVGTTYMASDVHRQFLFEPNPHVWDRDFALMAKQGINFVRTGMWTGWSRGIDEAFLRALDAYVQTAAKHRIVVTFTFFAFLPLAYGGTNPYLDPRSIEGQRQYITTIARRFRGVNWIHYDLINEPSYAPPEHLWSNHPIGDEWEKKALAQSGQRDFTVFSHEVVADWARKLRGFLREAGGDVLVTLGQDEGGTEWRPSQQLHADAVDYTAIHPWWQNDDVLANGVMVKVPEKPSLFQEVGLMRLEDANGFPWRSPELAASVLESKFAYAFAARSAGVVEWAWNINPYMPIDNESVIGFIRPDGTVKPEMRVVSEFAEFFRATTGWLDDFEPDPVVIVIPQSRLFMGRPGAMDGVRRMIRVLAERFGVVPTAISDLRLTKERLRHARLVIAPSVEFLDESAAQALAGATNVLVTGVMTGSGRPVMLREETPWGWATFDRDLRESLRASLDPRSAWHEPLPLEYAREEEPLARLLAGALEAAGIATHPSDSHVAARLLYAPRAVLAVVVNETTRDAQRRVSVAGRAIDIAVPAGRSRLVLFDRATGDVIVETK